MKTSADGLEKLTQREGKRNKSYLDTGGVWTNGVGHTGDDVCANQCVDDKQVMLWLSQDVVEAEECINKCVNVPLTQEQFDALVSFTFNVGNKALETSTLLKKLNAGDYQGAADQFGRWTLDNGKIIPGLVKRRAQEREQFLS